MRVFSEVNKKDIILVVVIISFLCVGTYYYTNHYLKLKRALYLVQEPFAKRTIRCSKNAPAFMKNLMEYTISTQKSMSNQLVYQSKNGEMHHCESGWEDGFRGERSITVDSRFRYASVTKVVTSALVLNLINQGKLNLDDKMVNIINLPEPKDLRLKDITVAMLLEHTAGFDRFKTYTPMLTMGKKPYCPTDIAQLANVKLDFEPGTQFQYSNLGYCLLGMIVEEKNQEEFRKVAEKKYQFNSKNIKFVDNDFLKDEIQYDYRYEEFYSEFYRNSFDFKDSLSAVGGLSGSAKAMVLVVREMLKDKPQNILSRTKQPCAIYLIDGCYGYALLPYQERGENFTIYGKEGYFPGVETDIFVDEHLGILAIFRGSTAPSINELTDLRGKIYQDLKAYYEMEKYVTF